MPSLADTQDKDNKTAPTLRRNRNDAANARRILSVVGEDLVFSEGRGENYFLWSNTQNRWEMLTERSLLTVARKALEQALDAEQAEYNAQHKGDDVKILEFENWKQSQINTHKLRAAIALLHTYDEVLRDRDFDSEALVLNTANSVLDLEDGPTNPIEAKDYLCTWRTAVPYVSDATAPKWEAFLCEMLPDPEHRAFFQRAMGLTLEGDMVVQKYFVHWGKGSNGKGTALETISLLLGDYAKNEQASIFSHRATGRQFGTVPWEGKRFMFVDEFSGRIDEEFVKTISGGGTVSAEVKRGGRWDFKPQFNLHFATNNFPPVADDAATERRFILMRWGQSRPSAYWSNLAEGYTKIARMFVETEGPGILNWLIKGWKEIQKRPGSLEDKLGVPESLRALAKEHLVASNPISSFLEECTEPVLTGQTTAAAMYEAYKRYCEEYENGKCEGKKTFNQILRNQYGFESNDSAKHLAWKNVIIKGVR